MSILNLTGINLPILAIAILSSFSSNTNTKKEATKSNENNNSKKTKLSETTKKDNTKNNDSSNSKEGDGMKSVNKKNPIPKKTIKGNTKIKKTNISSGTKLTEDIEDTKNIYTIDIDDKLIDECNKLEVNEIGKLLISSSALLQNNLAIYLKAETNKIEKLLSFIEENENKEISMEELLQFKTSVIDTMRSLEEIETQLNKKIKTGIELIKMHSHKYDFNSSSDDD